MKEKTKQILRYVACGLGGLALGIGLLGGLSMCATSGNKQTEEVNTIYANPKREQITTTEGGYAGYKISIPTLFYYQADDFNQGIVTVYNVDNSTYDLTTYERTFVTLADTSSASQCDAIKNQLESLASSSALRLFVWNCTFADALSGATGWSIYMTFVMPTQNVGQPMSFILTTQMPTMESRSISSGAWYTGGLVDFTQYYLTAAITDLVYFRSGDGTSYTDFPSFLNFQDVGSYYKESGYQNGNQAGYEEGYEDAYAEKDTGIAFTSCGVFPNAHVTLQTDETIGNFKYMYLCHYITKPGYDEHTIYILWTTHATTGQYLGQVIDRNDSNSYSPAVTLGTFTQEVTPSVTLTATEDMEFGLWVGYITSFHNRGEVTNSILWFGGGTSESDLQIYQNGYDEGYQNGNQAGQETGYEQGYERGQEVGDAEGYSRGYTEGFNQTNTKNVFSLFTSAFDSVASFFDLKIFGFLPLYWFFLAPLFIALISLLMRMVKH